MSIDHWPFWWRHAQDSILDERFPQRELSPEEEAAADKTIKPALELVLADQKIHSDIRSGALIALARISLGTEQEVARLIACAKDPGEDRIVHEGAIIGLGILGRNSEQVTAALRMIADDMRRNVRERCFALVALGLLRDTSEATFECCLRRLSGMESDPDARICAFLTIGLIGDASRAPALLEMFKTGRHGKLQFKGKERAFILDALGRIGSSLALTPAIEALAGDKDLDVRRSAAVAIGRLLPRVTKAQRESACRQIAALPRIEDRIARNLLLLGLARTAATLELTGAGSDLCLLPLRREVGSALESPDGGFVALAFAIGFERDDPRSFKLKALRNLFRAGVSGEVIRTPDLAAAHALALGLLRDDREETMGLLLESLGDRGATRRLRGAAAMALALIGDSRGAEPITKALPLRENRNFRIDLALAAGIIPNQGTTEAILRTMADPKSSQFTLGACATSLGRMRDFNALPKLIEILEPDATDGRYPDLSRAMVTVALGLLGNRRKGAPLSRIADGYPYWLSSPVLNELLTIL